MSSKKKVAPHEADSPKPLKVGGRVRCTDDGVEGRIVWANATAVKIRWDDGEQVTWRRDSLADRPLEILDPTDEPAAPSYEPVPMPAPERPTEPATAAQSPVEDADPPTPQLSTDPTAEPAAAEPTPAQEPATEPSPVAQAPDTPAAEPPVAEQSQVGESVKTGEKRQKEPKTKAEGKEKKRSALDAAAQVLAQASAPMNCQELIQAMAAQGLWSSPTGKTPQATLYSALLRELQTKGDQARFVKADRGKFALRDNGAEA
jgi:hypothetical protein